jgi:hypothetical protein
MAKVKLSLDEDVQLDLASALRKRGDEATHSCAGVGTEREKRSRTD